MSATTPDGLSLRDTIVRIDRAIAETEKSQAETRTFAAAQNKLAAEARNLGRQGYIQGALAVSGLVGGILAIIRFLMHLNGAPT